MSLRPLVAALVALVAAACASGSQQQAGGERAAAPAQSRQRITNQPPFDVATCHPRTLALPQPPNEAVLVGALVAARPHVMECLVDPRHRGQGKTTRVTLKTVVAEQGPTHSASGDNLTPEGQACVQRVMAERVPLKPLPKGGPPVEAQAEVVHEQASSPTVTFGINEGSDMSGQIRLAQARWCDCYAGYADREPPVLGATLRLARGQERPAEVTFEPAGTPEGDKLAACLRQKMMALPAKVTSDELTFPHRFVHFHSRVPEAAAHLTPELRFFQLELIRGQRAADAAIAFGTRALAADTYDALVQRYQQTKDFKLVAPLKSRCAELVRAADAWVAALAQQQQVDEATLTTVQELKAKDAAWAEVETASQAALKRTQDDLATARQRRKDDAAACPRARGD